MSNEWNNEWNNEQRMNGTTNGTTNNESNKWNNEICNFMVNRQNILSTRTSFFMSSASKTENVQEIKIKLLE